jgi:hypothetical protein
MKFSLSTLFYYTLFSSLFVFSCSQKDSNKKKEAANKGRQLELVEQVTFLTSEGEEVATLNVALADEPNERNQGLMDVNEMAPDAGMLFIFPVEAPRSFYMANTPLPLDIIFVSADSTIVRIYHNTTPFNSEQLPSEKPAKFVVETNGGYSVSNDIQEGMRIRF